MENQFVATEKKSGVTKSYIMFSLFVFLFFLVGMSIDIRAYAVSDFLFIPFFLVPHTFLFFIWLMATLSRRMKNPFLIMVTGVALGLGYLIFCYFMVLAIGSPFRNYAKYGTIAPTWEDQNIPRIK